MTDTIEDWAKIAAYREAYPLGEYGDPAIIADWPHMNCAIHALARRIQRDDITVEHLVAIAHGGPNHVSNLFLAHSRCNQRAGHLSAPEKISFRDKGEAK